MGKMLFSIVSWLLYVVFFLATVIHAIIASGGLWDSGFSRDDIVKGLHGTMYSALMLTVPLFMLWWLKEVTWQTLTFYTALLAVGFLTQATFQSLLDSWGLCILFLPLGIGSGVLSIYCRIRYKRHKQATVENAKQP